MVGRAPPYQSERTKKADDPHCHQPLLFHCPAAQQSEPAYDQLWLKTEGAANKLLEHNAEANTRVFEHISAVNSDYSAPFNARKLPFFLGQVYCPREIQLNHVTWLDRRRHGNRNEYSDLTDVGTSAVEEPIRFRHPDTNRPEKTRPTALPLLG